MYFQNRNIFQILEACYINCTDSVVIAQYIWKEKFIKMSLLKKFA
jgi:hypothetical protein